MANGVDFVHAFVLLALNDGLLVDELLFGQFAGDQFLGQLGVIPLKLFELPVLYIK